MKFIDLIEEVIGLEEVLGIKKTKRLISELEKVRDIAVEYIKELEQSKIENKTNTEKVQELINNLSILKRFFCIRFYDKTNKALLNDLELHYWRIIK